MRKLLSLFAAALLLAACESTSQDQAATGSEGATTSTESAASQADGASSDGVSSQAIPGPEGGTQEHLVVNVGDRVFFAFDKASLSDEAQSTVERLAAWMSEYPSATVTVEGHADERGTREYNLALGARRANAVRDYLIVLGVDPNRVKTVSFGEERPAVQGSNEEAWAQNRRAVFAVDQG
ncbi:peptidoglycan-associated lipoprotein Pal [Ferruginivarius sediminum]|jgi:peptidoglycan-associated lipoprotein|uniref:Peptidoglycan-associated lipoprotein n=1 Tax=Ferruginivarius sediminum TaxID=2661937 RepID=A0A369T490_9PROT|nr:peptidoglycan-associated lipoprotein Pal [Ferruginivarius sediminum]RDD60160.1 peptidoglycan-associated lipoprotein Pal [Ferruginivarius sediminum]